MQNDHYQPQPNWWDRNWKWFVPTGCLSLIVIAGIFAAGIFFGITSIMKNSDVYKESITIVQHNKLAVEKLGNPIETDGMISGRISLKNETGKCDIQIPLKGSKDKGTLFVVGQKRGKWKYSEMTLYIEKTDQEIDLLQK